MPVGRLPAFIGAEMVFIGSEVAGPGVFQCHRFFFLLPNGFFRLLGFFGHYLGFFNVKSQSRHQQGHRRQRQRRRWGQQALQSGPNRRRRHADTGLRLKIVRRKRAEPRRTRLPMAPSACLGGRFFCMQNLYFWTSRFGRALRSSGALIFVFLYSYFFATSAPERSAPERSGALRTGFFPDWEKS